MHHIAVVIENNKSKILKNVRRKNTPLQTTKPTKKLSM